MGPIYQLLLMSTTKLNIVIEKATYHRMLWVCLSFDYKFQYILVSWEGSAADSRVLASALSRSDALVVPPGMWNQLVNV